MGDDKRMVRLMRIDGCIAMWVYRDVSLKGAGYACIFQREWI